MVATKRPSHSLILCATALAVASALVQPTVAARAINVLDLASLELVNAKADVVTYKGRQALRLVQGTDADAAGLAIVKGLTFQNGEIAVSGAGEPAPGAPEGSRGFAGFAFRLASADAYENFYLRPTNGRAEDQLRRNHAVQYESRPDFPWFRLRKETPGQYESYADMETGAWTACRAVVDGVKARFFVNGASQPTLIVNDLKLGAKGGSRVALWIGQGTVAHFAGLEIEPR